MINAKTTEEVALGIRRRVFEHSIRNNGGYLSQACSAADQLAWLYNEELRLGEPTLPMIPKPFAGVPSATNRDYHTGAGYNGPPEPQYDRLIIAPAHYALAAYATLIEVGRMAAEGLEMFNQDGSSVEMIGAEHSPGMEVHNGTLGIGLSTGAGLAWGRRRKGETGRVWVFMSDGEIQEGQTWEAVQTAAYHGIDNLLRHHGRERAAVRRRHGEGDGGRRHQGQARGFRRLRGGNRRPRRRGDASGGETAPSGQAAGDSGSHHPYRGMSPLKSRFPRLHYVRFKSEEERAQMNSAIAAELGVAPIEYIP